MMPSMSFRLKHIALLLPLVLSTLFASFSISAQQDELLRPEQAFKLTARVEGNHLIANYDIAPGYYMYRKRFEFDVETPGAQFGTPVIPPGKVKQDEFFGEVETYRDSLRIELPILFDAGSLKTIEVKATGQGCADIGICYPPLDQLLVATIGSDQTIEAKPYVAKPKTSDITTNDSDLQSLLLATAGQPAQQSSAFQSDLTSDKSGMSELQSLGDLIGLSDESEIPHPDSAFVLTAEMNADHSVDTHITIMPTAYLYRDKVDIKLVSGSGRSIGKLVTPPGDEKNDEFFGLTEVYHDAVDISIPISTSSNPSQFFTLAYSYQGCIEDRICYPPITKYLRVNGSTGTVTISAEPPASLTVNASSQALTSATKPSVSSDAPQSEQDQYAQLLLQNKSLLLVIGLFFLAGVGLTFTPCVFPMIPILSSIIAGQGEKVSTRSAFNLSLVYVLAMAVTYALAGAIVGYYGSEYNIQIWFQDPIILSIFAAIFALLALSMFGFYDLQMPNAIQSRLTAFSNKQPGGSLAGAGVMGFFSAVIVGPCITAPLVGALLFISQTQNWQLGGLALFALGIGMGTPLLLIGTSAGKILPRAGGWMDTVKSVFGVVMLAMAIWLLERILPTSVTMALMAILIITSAIYMGALEKLPQPTNGWRKLCKGLGVILLIYGAVYLIGAASGSKDLIQPLKGIASGMTANSRLNQVNNYQPDHITFKQVKGSEGLKSALKTSVADNKPTMLDFYADWCISCKEMEKYAFTHPDVLASLSGVVTLQSDVTANDSIDSALMKSLGIYGPPAILFFDKNGQEIRNRRVVGEMSGEDFAAHIQTTFN
jgi:thiol:disulfide interchange protein DsbD